MPDCAQCNRPLSLTNRRCKTCGACEGCCQCPEPRKFFHPLELGLITPEQAEKMTFGEEYTNA